MTKSQQAIRDPAKATPEVTGSLAPLPAVFSGKIARAVRTVRDGVSDAKAQFAK
jgi:hypothetical protein